MLVEITDWQQFHPLEDALAQTQHRALRHVDHQTVVGVGADDTDEQYASEFKEGLGERAVCRCSHLGEWHDVVIDQRTCKKGGGEGGHRGDGDADEDGKDGELVVLQHIFR